MGVVSHGDGYYPLVKGDGERRRGSWTRPGDSNIKRQREEEVPTQRKMRGNQRERRKTREGWHPQSQESSVIRGKWPRAQAAVPATAESPQEMGQKGIPICGLMKATNGHNKGSFAGVGGGMWIGRGANCQ